MELNIVINKDNPRTQVSFRCNKEERTKQMADKLNDTCFEVCASFDQSIETVTYSPDDIIEAYKRGLEVGKKLAKKIKQ